MLKTSLITGSIMLVAIYIAFGDQIPFLTPPMKKTSYDTRTAIVKFSTGLIPKWAKKDPSKRTNDAIDKEQQGVPATQ